MLGAKTFLKLLPWMLVAVLAAWLFLSGGSGFKRIEGTKETIQNTLLTKVESLGKLELVKYSFQEVTEVKKMADVIDFKLFKYKTVPDAKAVLISRGSATGCIDLTKIGKKDITEQNDTIYVTLPTPEICYFKVDLENSRLYDLQVTYMPDDERKKFIQELYKVAEQEIKQSALNTGILEQTKDNARLILKPLFENISGKVVYFQFLPKAESLPIEVG